jgi:IclR family transcriptional regulator, acetate operon repressor
MCNPESATQMIVKQALYAFQILEFFADRKKPATLSEIADHFGWPRSSTFNLIETLSKSGLLYELKFRAGYYPTRRLLDLARDIIADGPLSERLCAMVSNVAERTGETVALAALSGLSAVFVEVVESRSLVRYAAKVGQRVPLHATSCGRAILSMIAPKERATMLQKCEYERFAPDSLMTPAAVEADIQLSIGRGWFLNDNGYAPDLLGLAIPLPLTDRQLTLMVAGPSFRMLDRLPELAGVLRSEIDRYTAEAGQAGLELSASM